MADLFSNLALGFGVAFIPDQSHAVPDRRAGRHAGRRAAGHRHHRHGGDAAADHLRPAAGRRADHARRHLLRRAVRRFDHLDPGQHSRRGRVGGDGARRLPDGEAGPRRSGAGDRRDRIVLRRLRRDRSDRRAGRAAHQARAGVRPGRIFLADGARPDLRGGARQGIGAEGDRDDRVRPAALDGRLRHRNRRLAHGLQHSGTGRRSRLRDGGDGPVRLCRDHPQSRCRRRKRPRTGAAEGHGTDADGKGSERFGAGHPARHRARIDPRHSAGRRRRDRVVRGLYAREEDRQGSVAVRPRRDRRRCGAGERQQCRGADLVHSAADARHSAERGDGADGRRDDHSRHRAGSAGDAEAAGTGLGHDRLDVGRQSDAADHQPAAGRHLGAAVARAVSPDVPVAS